MAKLVYPSLFPLPRDRFCAFSSPAPVILHFFLCITISPPPLVPPVLSVVVYSSHCVFVFPPLDPRGNGTQFVLEILDCSLPTYCLVVLLTIRLWSRSPICCSSHPRPPPPYVATAYPIIPGPWTSAGFSSWNGPDQMHDCCSDDENDSRAVGRAGSTAPPRARGFAGGDGQTGAFFFRADRVPFAPVDWRGGGGYEQR